ncbi:DNA polymerase IV (plasmid) [Oscillospiraceae bacterium MB08-C2-2]|nr:DNA polymerase IV [Oscillospiraceae bacterium MB08-C2-2]
MHVDMNNFYASVECLYRPELRKLPVAVGGDPEQRHGIVLAKNQIAKQFGVQTGEALWQARQKCPKIVFVPPNFDRYLRFSQMARDIYYKYTDQIEPFGIDEAWLDVTGSTGLYGSGETIANKIRNQIKAELGVTVSVGVSWNKIFAKLGSDVKKPDAVTIISKENYKQVAWSLPASDLLYVGRQTGKKLHRHYIDTIGAIAQENPAWLKARLGKWGEFLWTFANGYDISPVSKCGEESFIKSIGHSQTTMRDVENEEEVKMLVYVLAESVAARMREHGFKARTVAISVSDSELIGYGKQGKTKQPTLLVTDIAKTAMELFRQLYPWKHSIRSVGIKATDFMLDSAPVQLDIFADSGRADKEEKIERAVDILRQRFGPYSIQRGVVLQDTKLTGFAPKTDHVIHPISFF